MKPQGFIWTRKWHCDIWWRRRHPSHRWNHRAGVCCMSFHRRGWDQSSFCVRNNPIPGVWSVASDRRDTSSPGSGSEGTVDTDRGGTPAGTGELHSLTSWTEDSERQRAVGETGRMGRTDDEQTYIPQIFSQEKWPEPSNPSLSVPHRTWRVVTPQ